MSVIRVLPESVSNRIAAGEVIERPASVVKELVENSIDAHATSVSITIENSGIKLISVVDNGTGMDRDDALLCFEPHATSKISNEKDIDVITTMGFRGEAIPSIASVSKFRLKTRQRDTLEGTEVVVHGGKYVSELPAGCAAGTEITVADLFYNTPARKKFLKARATEEKHIFETVCLLALSNPLISFELKIDGRQVISSPGEKSLLPRLSMLLGREVVESSIEVDSEENGIRVTGYISRPGLLRNSRREQRFFINGRPFRSNILHVAIKDAYQNLVMKDSFPVVTLFIIMNPAEIDVNVHPAKSEVRFRNERQVAEVIREAVRRELYKAIKPLTSVDTHKVPLGAVFGNAEVSYTPPVEGKEMSIQGGLFKVPELPDSGAGMPDVKSREMHVQSVRPSDTPEIARGMDEPAGAGDLILPGCGKLELLSVIDRTYILARCDTGLIIIDQHAAHERIIFERLLNDYRDQRLSQHLLIPVTVALSRAETGFITRYMEYFSSIGFEIDIFGTDTVLVSAVPHSVPLGNISGLISDILDGLINDSEQHVKIDEAAVARQACRFAVKASDYLMKMEIAELVRQLSKCRFPFTCPHGRPTLINISFRELEKRFGRVL